MWLSTVVFIPSASAVEEKWQFSDDLRRGRAGRNPLLDKRGDEVWYFLRTTSAKGPLGQRQWIRDGKYLPIERFEARIMNSPVRGWVYDPRSSPLIGMVDAPYQLGLGLKKGDPVVAPGRDFAVVLGWKSPVAGQLVADGVFEHAQKCCGVNSRINWYIYLGPKDGKGPGKELARGTSDFGTKDAAARFKLPPQDIAIDQFVYFIVDSLADGTGTPHHGDLTRFDVTLTVRNATRPAPPQFESDVRPILAKTCFECHGNDTQESQLDLRTVTSILQGGENGHAIVPGNASKSILMDMIERGQMPPEAAAELSKKEVSILRRWIQAGAPSQEKVRKLPPRTFVSDRDREFWSFRPLSNPTLPNVRGVERIRTPIDRFILARLESNGLNFSQPAPRTALLRRLYIDLVGIPPTIDEQQAFLRDTRPDAWSRAVDRLLASPRYGERWGRHWLDTIGYVDNRLFDGDLGTIYPNENIWRFRDYVIGAFNSNKPFNEFLREQLAGDEMIDWRNARRYDPRTVELLTATGFFRSIEDHTSEAQYGIAKRYEVVFDTMEMLSTSMMGLTLHCSRCHNHKFDPVSQRDYYRLMATIEPALNPAKWVRPQERWLADVSPQQRREIDAHNQRIDSQITTKQKTLAELRKAKKPNEAKTIQQQIEQLAAGKKSYAKIQALWDVGDAPASRVLRRGSVGAPGVLVQPGFVEVLSRPNQVNARRPPTTQGKSTGMRLALANWLTSGDHPLTSRVFVNRVWHHHFGRGIVSTISNLGRSGARPTHPELLDWMAKDFQDHGWDIKRLHRVIVTSAVYRQSTSRTSPDARGERVDPDNRLLWRMNLRRLEAEIVRDAILAVSDRLDTTVGGPPTMITKPGSGLSREVKSKGTGAHQRRSVYLFARRVYPLKFLEVFDAPIMAVNCRGRKNSATVLQSFTQLNDSFMIRHATATATKILKQNEASRDLQVKMAFRTLLSRSPTTEELAHCRDFLQRQSQQYSRGPESPDAAAPSLAALTDLCHMLICTNEFLYVE